MNKTIHEARNKKSQGINNRNHEQTLEIFKEINYQQRKKLNCSMLTSYRSCFSSTKPGILQRLMKPV